MASNRPVPYVRIIHQPSSVYRMRYRKENRSTFLLAENASQQQTNDANSPQGAGGGGTKKPVRKKTGAGAGSDSQDGTYPKIEVNFYISPMANLKKKFHHIIFFRHSENSKN